MTVLSARIKHRLVDLIGVIALVDMAARTVLLDVEEVVPHGADIGELLYDLSLAYVGAWIFNHLVVVRPRRESLRRIYEVERRNLDAIAGSGDAVIGLLARAAGMPASDEVPTLEQVRAMCSAIPANGEDGERLIRWGPPHDYATWLQSLHALSRRALGYHDRVVGAYGLMDVPLVALLRAAAESSFHQQVAFAEAAPLQANASLGHLAEPIYQYWWHCQSVRIFLRESVDPLLGLSV